MSIDNTRRSQLRDGRRYNLRGLRAFELSSDLKTLSAHTERRSDLSRLSAHTERLSDLRGMSAHTERSSELRGVSDHTERRSELKRLSAHNDRRSGMRGVSAQELRSKLNRLSAHTERRFGLRRVSAHTERRSDLRRVSAYTKRRSDLRRVSAHTKRRSDLRRRLRASSLKLKRRGYEQRRCGARLLRSRQHHSTCDARCSLQILWSVLYKRRKRRSRQRWESEGREQEPRLWALPNLSTARTTRTLAMRSARVVQAM